MKALILTYQCTVGDQLYVGVSFVNPQGAIVDAQNIGLGNFTISAISDIATAAQNAILTYSTAQGYGMTSADIMNPASATVGLT
jgi:hypothetical protein